MNGGIPLRSAKKQSNIINMNGSGKNKLIPLEIRCLVVIQREITFPIAKVEEEEKQEDDDSVFI